MSDRLSIGSAPSQDNGQEATASRSECRLFQEAEDHSKGAVAFSSVVAAIALTLMKLIVGLMTGSLGILAEAAHSGLDLAAALMTFIAVRMSGRPADSKYTYGYGKVENLSALFETLLLLLTCVWVIYEALQRLFFAPVEIEANLWAFLVMGISIAIDLGRSRALARAAKQYDSQALEADALHFSTDIWSSAVVIGGLALVRLSEWIGAEWLSRADAVAAMGVAGIIVFVSVQLGQRAIAGLLDAVPSGMRVRLLQAARVQGVLEVKRVRVRKSGPQTFADITLVVSSDTSFERAYVIASTAKSAVSAMLPRVDILIDVVPLVSEKESALTTIRRLAARHGLSAHGVRIYDNGSNRNSIELHVEVNDSLSLAEAHAKATAFEETLRKNLPRVDDIITHIEPTIETSTPHPAVPAEELTLLDALRSLSDEVGIECHPHDAIVHRAAHELSLSFHCHLDAQLPVTHAHALTEQLESVLRGKVPNLGRVIIHTEPTD